MTEQIGKGVALVASGSMVNSALAAAELLQQSGVAATVADMRRARAPHLSVATPRRNRFPHAGRIIFSCLTYHIL